MPWFSMVILTSSRFLASLFKLKNTKPLAWVKKKAFLLDGTKEEKEGLGQCPPENTGSIYRSPSVALSPIVLLEESNVLIWESELRS